MAHARADYFVLRQVFSIPCAEHTSCKAGSEALHMHGTAEDAGSLQVTWVKYQLLAIHPS